MDAKAHDTVQLVATVRDAWQVSQANQIVVIEAMGSIYEFMQKFLKMLTELQRRILQNGEVKRIASGEGPSTKPTIQGPGEKST
ncbi:MAG: hypothetical protein K0S45_3433 [Nitrospira sp.]|nr:hypothetical protein [Nitrospira sp.]